MLINIVPAIATARASLGVATVFYLSSMTELHGTLLPESTKRALRDIVLASSVVNVLGLAAPIASIVVFNKVLPHQATATLTVVTVGMLIVLLFDAALRTARNMIAVHAGARLDAAIGNRVMRHVLRLPISYFERNAHSDIEERVRQLDTVRAFLTGEMPMLLVDLVFSALGFAVLLAIDWRIGLLVLLMVPAFAGLSVLTDGAQRRLAEAGFAAGASKTGALNEILGGALTIKAMGLQAHMESRFGARLGDAAWAGYRSQNLAGYLASVSNLLHGLASLLVLVVGAELTMLGQLSVGALVACSMLAGRVLAPVRYLAMAWHRLRQAQQAYGRLDRLLQETPEAETEAGFELPAGRQPLRCAHVRFLHTGALQAVLSDVSLTLAPGTITGLIGTSGSGKTTLGKLLAGIYHPTAGGVSVGSIAISQVAGGALRRQLGYVPQDAFLFAGTVLENILFGLPSEANARALEAAQFTGAHGFIQTLPQGYGTRVGEGGLGLSAGQRQLLAITRVVVRNPRLLVLDEVTSALDAEAEAHLMRNLQRAARSAGLVVLVITHRPTTLAFCDRVALLAGGRIVQEGTSQDLMPLLHGKRPSGSHAVPAGVP